MINFGDALLIMGVLGIAIGSVLIFLGLRELKKNKTRERQV